MVRRRPRIRSGIRPIESCSSVLLQNRFLDCFSMEDSIGRQWVECGRTTLSTNLGEPVTMLLCRRFGRVRFHASGSDRWMTPRDRDKDNVFARPRAALHRPSRKPFRYYHANANAKLSSSGVSLCRPPRPLHAIAE